MPLISVSKAAKLFDVSRPTLQKALKDGAITGGKVMAGGSESWQIDTAELSRLYALRDPVPDNLPRQDSDSGQRLVTEKSGNNGALSGEVVKTLEAELQAARAEIYALRAGKADAERELALAKALADARGEHLDDLRRLLPKTENQSQRQGLWKRIFGGG